MNKYILILLFVFLLYAELNAEPDSNPYDPDNSIGFIFFSNSLSSLSEKIHLPRNTKIPLYQGIGSKNPIGYFFAPNCKYATQECWEITFTMNNVQRHVSINDFAAVAYDGYCLQFYSVDHNYIKVLEKSTTSNLYFSIDDLSQYGLSYIIWKEYLFIVQKWFFPLIPLNLRKQPDQNSDKIITLMKKNYRIRLSGKKKGDWAEVEVEKCKDHCFEINPEIIEKYIGWTKIFDDHGFPNIWFASKGE